MRGLYRWGPAIAASPAAPALLMGGVAVLVGLASVAAAAFWFERPPPDGGSDVSQGSSNEDIAAGLDRDLDTDLLSDVGGPSAAT